VKRAAPASASAIMVKDQFPADRRPSYCLAEGGGVVRIGGDVQYATVQTLEKIPRGIELVGARHLGSWIRAAQVERHIVHLAGAVAKVGDWRPEVRFNETTGTYFRSSRRISPPEVAKYYRDVLSTDPGVRRAADDWLFENEPRHSSMLRTSVSPNIFTGGYRSNVIPQRPSDARRACSAGRGSGEVPRAGQAGRERNPAVEGRFITGQNERPAGARRAAGQRSLQGARGRRHARLQRADAADDEHWSDRHGAAAREGACNASASARRPTSRIPRRASAAHSDQERLLESELHRFVRFKLGRDHESRGSEMNARGAGQGLPPLRVPRFGAPRSAGLSSCSVRSRSRRCSRRPLRRRTGRTSRAR